MKTGTFVCSCADTCDIDLEDAREGVQGVDVAASSQMLCGDGLEGMEAVIEEHELDQLVISCPEPGVQESLRETAADHGLHPDAVEFVDQREGAGWVHDEGAATDKTARLLNAASAGLEHEAFGSDHTEEAGDEVMVVGDPETAVALADEADVTLVADGEELAGAPDLDEVTVERGRPVGVDGRFGEFTVELQAGITEDCISCMKCLEEGPDDHMTARPVDVEPDAPRGDWEECCPVDAIEVDGVAREIEVDQVVWPAATNQARGGRVGFYTGPVDAGTISAVTSLLGGVSKPDHLDLAMDVCASGASSKVGCNECVEACPHDAVGRPRVDEVEFDRTACQNCGACTSSCPTGAVQLSEPSNERLAREVEALMEPTVDDDGGWLFGGSNEGIESPVVAFVCSERAAEALSEFGQRAAAGDDVDYPPILPVNVNCTDTVGEGHVMHALAAGADGVAIVGCGGSCLHSGPDPKAELVDRLNTATADLGLGKRVEFFAPDREEPAAFEQELGRFVVETLDPSPVPAGSHEATGRIDVDASGTPDGAAVTDGGVAAGSVDGTPPRPNPDFDNHAWTLESVRSILEHVDPERDVIRGLENFGNVEVSDACTLTPTCSNMCPTDALARDEETADLRFNHELCVNCGLCEEGCVEDAIEVEEGLHLDLLPENNGGDPWTTVFDGEMRECAMCGTPFTSEGSAAKVQEEVGDLVTGMAPGDKNIFEYCNDCRARILFDQGDGPDTGPGGQGSAPGEPGPGANPGEPGSGPGGDGQ